MLLVVALEETNLSDWKNLIMIVMIMKMMLEVSDNDVDDNDNDDDELTTWSKVCHGNDKFW